MDERQIKAKAYWRLKYALMLLGFVMTFALLILLQLSGLSAHFKAAALRFSSNIFAALAVYLAFFSIIVGAVMLPLNIYEGFVIEHRYGLSHQSLRQWFGDQFKAGAISFVIFLMLIESFYAMAVNLPCIWWIVAAIFWTAVSVVMARLFPVMIVPLFFKYTPLDDGDLRRRALALAEKFSMKVMNVYEIDFSKKTARSNAAVIGLGPTKRIVFADNLLKEFNPDEIEVILAHEMAHQKLNHIWKFLAMNSVSIIILFYLLNVILPGLVKAFGANGAIDMAIFPAIYLIFIVYELITMPFKNGFSRKFENDADVMALKVTGLRDAFISAMEKLAERNLSDRDPAPIIEFLLYNHPSIAKRIGLAQRISL